MYYFSFQTLGELNFIGFRGHSSAGARTETTPFLFPKMSVSLSEAETILNSLSSNLSYSSQSTMKVETATPTVTELSVGSFKVNCELNASPPTRTVTFSSRFNVFHQCLRQSSMYVITFHRSATSRESVNWFRLTCCAPTNDANSTPNCLPISVSLDGADGKTVVASPTSDTSTDWVATFRAIKTVGMLVIHLQFQSTPFVELYRFLERQEVCDVTFKFPCGRVYKAHKVVLCLDCSYFQALFRSNCKETLTGEVPVVGIPYDTFKDAIGYLYTRMIPARYCTADGLDDLVMMCQIANQYSCDSLLTYCGRLLIPQLDLSNVVALFDWSKSVNLPHVEKAAMIFMTNNFSAMCHHPDVIDYAKENSKTLLQVFEAIFNHIKERK